LRVCPINPAKLHSSSRNDPLTERELRGVTRGNIAAAAIAGACAIAAICAVVAAVPRSASPYQKLAVFARVLSHVERSYVRDVDEGELITGAIKGMVRTLDPHSSYMSREEFEIIQADTRGNFAGVGLEVSIRDGFITVIAPISGSPAERAGMEPGDAIVSIEGASTLNMDLEHAVRLMRGEEGTTVTVTVRREGVEEPFDVSLEREIIQVESVSGELLAPGFPRIWIKGFQDGTASEVRDAIDGLSMEGGGLDGILLDLRRNPGGLVDEAVRVADLFLREGMITSTRGRGDVILNEYEAKARGTHYDVPVVALVDGGSASAAEIVAGALQDHGRAMIVGTRTFGKGSVQSLIPIQDGSGLKLTIALYYTPSGRSLQAEGVEPDILIESRKPPAPDEETAILNKMPPERELPGHLQSQKTGEGSEDDPEIEDLQLRVAFHVLRGLSRAKKARDGRGD